MVLNRKSDMTAAFEGKANGVNFGGWFDQDDQEWNIFAYVDKLRTETSLPFSIEEESLAKEQAEVLAWDLSDDIGN